MYFNYYNDSKGLDPCIYCTVFDYVYVWINGNLTVYTVFSIQVINVYMWRCTILYKC